ncbi:ClpP/TepA [Cynara cardunculus var. scolymus]|uniref:ClpP/TepA n=1 Tax=Cynara cardunculus var. scolymus TaxID=59895 RepID=A0A124SFE8_CYNCS|nr:ClpP/TepA [Cynara cardunculus var. scolymus]
MKQTPDTCSGKCEKTTPGQISIKRKKVVAMKVSFVGYRANLSIILQRTGKPLWVVSEDMERDVFMSATEAQAYGIVDLVAVE